MHKRVTKERFEGVDSTLSKTRLTDYLKRANTQKQWSDCNGGDVQFTKDFKPIIIYL
jgi:hypothetical protein